VFLRAQGRAHGPPPASILAAGPFSRKDPPNTAPGRTSTQTAWKETFPKEQAAPAKRAHARVPRQRASAPTALPGNDRQSRAVNQGRRLTQRYRNNNPECLRQGEGGWPLERKNGVA